LLTTRPNETGSWTDLRVIFSPSGTERFVLIGVISWISWNSLLQAQEELHALQRKHELRQEVLELVERLVELTGAAEIPDSLQQVGRLFPLMAEIFFI